VWHEWLALGWQGARSHLAVPGFALCSPEVAADPHAARQLLHDLFTAGPDDPPLARWAAESGAGSS
jgi:hypothetical protein